MVPASALLLSIVQPFAVVFTAPTFAHALTLVQGTLLASGRRTVAAALRAVGQGEQQHCTTYHRVLNRNQWSPLRLSRILLQLLVTTFLAADAPLVLLVDGTLERRWGPKIRLKGRYHDAVRSQTGHVATSEGIQWLCFRLVEQLEAIPHSRLVRSFDARVLQQIEVEVFGDPGVRCVPANVRPLDRVGPT
jgi:hypothetical protein